MGQEEKEKREPKLILDESIRTFKGKGTSSYYTERLKDYSVINMDNETIESITEKVAEAKKSNPKVAILGTGDSGKMSLVQAIIKSHKINPILLVIDDVESFNKPSIRISDVDIIGMQDFGYAQTANPEKGKTGDLSEAILAKNKYDLTSLKEMYIEDEGTKYGQVKNRKCSNKKIKKRKKAKNGKRG